MHVHFKQIIKMRVFLHYNQFIYLLLSSSVV